MEDDEKNIFFPSSHGCAFCKNLLNLSETCCCLDADLIEVTEPRLLKRGNLKKGDRLCSMHYDKVQNGLIFGVEKGGCCAPFHVAGSEGNRLRSVPRTWRHLFNTSSFRERYSPSLQICNRCYKITFDLTIRGEGNFTGASSTWDLSPSSPNSVLSSGSYTSPRKWLSSFNINGNESSASGSSLSSSTTNLSSTSSSSYLLSLYETHRENLGHPRTVPDSIRRYFKYKQNTPFSSSLATPQSPELHRNNRTSVSTDSDVGEISSKQEISSPTFIEEPKFQSYSSDIPLSFSTPSITPSRHANKLILAPKNVSETKAESESSQSKSSSFEIDSDWESISISALSEVDADYNEPCDSASANPSQTKEFAVSVTPRRVSSCSSLSSSSNSEERSRPAAKPSGMSIDIQFVVNPLLKRPHLTSQAEMCKSFDSFSTNTDELISRAENFENLDILERSSSSENFDHSYDSDVRSVDTDELLTEQSIENDPNEMHEDSVITNSTNVQKTMNTSGLYQTDDKTELIRHRSHHNIFLLQLFANTLSQCIVNFALEETYRCLCNKECSQMQSETAFSSDEYEHCSSTKSEKSSDSDLKIFSDLQAEMILSNVSKNQNDHQSSLLQKSELLVYTPTTQYLSLDPALTHRTMVNNESIPNSSKTVIRWLEKKDCFRTVFSIQFVQKVSKPRTFGDKSENDEDFNLKLGDSMTLGFNPSDFRLVECVVDDLIPFTRSLSTGFIDKHEDLEEQESFIRLRSSSLDSFFTLTCKPTSKVESLDKQFTAVPINRLRSPGEESGVFVSTSTVERFSSEDDDAHIEGGIEYLDRLTAFDTISISSGATDFSSTSTLDDSDIIQAQLLETSKISDRPHFVSHKSRIEEHNEPISRNLNVPFELKPVLPAFPEEDEEDNKSIESFGATLEMESQYEDAFSTTGAAENANKDSTEKNTTDATLSSKQSPDPASEDPANRKRKMSTVNKKEAKSFDWYVGEELLEQRRSKQLLKALSNAALFTTQTQKSRRDVRVRKTDEEPEEEDVPDVISHALEEFTPKFLLRRPREESNESTHSRTKFVIRIVAVFGLVGSLVYAGWKFYS